MKKDGFIKVGTAAIFLPRLRPRKIVAVPTFEDGLSLLEVLVAAMLFSLVVAGLAAVFVSGKSLLLHSRSRMTAGELGKYFLDPLQKQVDQKEWGSNCLGTGTLANCQGLPDSITIDRDYTASYNVTPDYDSTSLSKVKVEVKWTEPEP